jgi:cellulose synthase/poly-beta-1,6-N-acetylglucosamine synthase-like glycosyltransferase
VVENLPFVTVLIAARPGQAELRAVTASRALDYPPEKLEILVARGKQPSAQRNAALKAARGDLVYFLDDDSVPLPGNLRLAVPHFTRLEAKMVGGPNLCPPDAPELEQVFALVLASRAFGPVRARYAVVGGVRETTEKELILCNLFARRDAMLELGGFNEALYPNEENALMDELQKRGGKLIYEPHCYVYRRPRSTLRAFARMFLTYGRGRAEQFRLHPTLGSVPNFGPPAFCLYLVVLVVMLACSPTLGRLLMAPLALYALLVLLMAAGLVAVHGPQSTRAGLGRRLLRSLAAFPLIMMGHVLYGLGFWRGLFTTLRSEGRPPAEVVLERL